ncbi:hypothetical protein [Spirosoma fluminis]
MNPHGNSLFVFLTGLLFLILSRYLRGPVTYRRDRLSSVAGFCVGIVLLSFLHLAKRIRP